MRVTNMNLGNMANMLLEFEEYEEKLEKRNEELELLTDKLLEEKAELIKELDEANNENLRLEQRIQDQMEHMDALERSK